MKNKTKKLIFIMVALLLTAIFSACADLTGELGKNSSTSSVEASQDDSSSSTGNTEENSSNSSESTEESSSNSSEGMEDDTGDSSSSESEYGCQEDIFGDEWWGNEK